MKSATHFISVDWGTTNLRAHLVEYSGSEILKSISTEQGMKAIYAAFSDQNLKSQRRFISDFLLDTLAPLLSEDTSIPIVASGMGSSSIGIKELPYAEFPIDSSGATISFECLPLKNGNELILISGAKDNIGFMRGEEIQAIGLSDHLADAVQSTLILCGTHSKHLRYENGKFSEMKNFMTGELFEVLVNHSILSHSVEKVKYNEQYQQSFLQGVRSGLKEKLTAQLLSIRSADLIRKQHPTKNYFYLSGMLIGNELAYLTNESTAIYLAASDELQLLYTLALEAVVPTERITSISQSELEKATIRGHKKVLKRYYE